MPASAASLSQSESPENPSNPRRPLVGWICAVGLVVLFAVSMMLVPPVTNAAKALPTPEWALFFGRFHPIAVHLPVGVLIMAAFMEALVMLRFPLGQAVKGSVGFVMGFGAFGAIVAVVFGILLSREGGYKGGMFAAHQALGIATVVGSLLALIFKQISEDSGGRIRFVYRGLMFLTLGIMSLGAHFGGNMVHGSDYLLEYAPKDVRNTVRTVEAKVVDLFAPAAVHDDVTSVNADTPAPEPAPVGTPAPAMVPEANGSEVGGGPAAPAPTPSPAPAPAVATVDAVGSPTFYAAVVAPLMEAKCNNCHNADKSKGDLRLDNHEGILKGGENGDNVVVGDPEKSLLVARMKLPVDHDDHMPPENKDQPTAEEIELVAIWVKAGASKELKVTDANVPDNLKPALQTLLSKVKGGSGGSTPPIMVTLAEAAAQTPAAGGVDPAVAEAMKKINGTGASLAPVAQNAKELRFTALNVARDYSDANLKELESIGSSLVALDLARTKVTDAGLAALAKMTNLKELHLENTAVTDAAGSSLKGLAKLEYLNLYGTKVTDKILVDLEGLTALKSLYLWQTGVTEPAAEAFRAKRPGLLVNIGWSEKDNAKVVAAPAPAAAPVPAPAPEKPAAPAPAAAPAGKADPNAKIYADIVAPILAAKCNGCHGSEKSKGKLRMHTFADLLKGGGDGPTTVIANNAKESLLLVRAKLPLDDDDHMPPSDEPQLTKEELVLLEWWVAEGASETLTLAAAKKTPEIEGFANAYLAAKKPAAAPVVAKVEPKAPAPAPAPAATPAPAPAKPEAAPVVAAAGKALDPNAKIYDELVAPILAAKCNACHGTDKSKGKLKMHTFADLLKGGSDGATTVIAGNTKDSLLLVRAKLPKEDDEHMPPTDEPQLSKEELAFLEWWIAEGASESLTFANAKKTPEIETIAKALYAAAKPAKADGGKKTAEKPKAKPLTDAEKKTIAEVSAKVTALNASMMAVSLDSEQLRLGTVNAADKFGDKELALLAPVNPHLIWVDLARTKVTDSGLAMVAGMSNLERLHLENTAITDAGLDHLAKLGKLEYLNLYGTKVTDAGLAKLASAKSLKKLFVWQTGATREGAKKLEAQIPGLVVNVGLSEAEIAKLIEAAQPPPKPAEAPKPAAAPAPAPAKPEEKKPEAKKPETPAAAPAPAPAKPAEAKPAEVKKPDAVPAPAPAPKPEEKKPDAPPAAPVPAADANKK